MPRSLITGVTGQDGWYLARLLRAAGHEVFGLVSSGDPGGAVPGGAVPGGVVPDGAVPDGVVPVAGDLRSGESLRRALDVACPDVVFNLASASSVAASWREPELVADVNGMGVVRLLAAMADRSDRRGGVARLVQASSAEIFGDAPAPQDESTPIRPSTPYGAAKALAQHAVAVYRTAGLFASTAVLYNHESPRRPSHFVSRKITSAVARIAAGSDELLPLGNLAARRDWGHAGDYVRALALIGAHDEPGDFVIASGVSRTVEEFVAVAFAHVGIADWSRHVRIDPDLVRPVEPVDQRGDASRAHELLGWYPEISFEQLVAEMVDADLAALRAVR